MNYFIGKYKNIGKSIYLIVALSMTLEGYGQIDEEFYSIKNNPTGTNKIAGEFFIKGNEKLYLKDYFGAIKDYSSAIEIDSMMESAYLNRGFAKHLLHDHRGQIEDCNKALRIDSTDESAYMNRAGARHNLKDNKGAIVDLNKAITIKPMDARLFLARASLKDDLNDYWGEIDDLTAAIAIKPKAGILYIYRGKAEIKVGQKDNGCLDLSKAGELGEEKAYDLILQDCH
jgi:tetratricopeptide (TPR) repeat protein